MAGGGELNRKNAGFPQVLGIPSLLVVFGALCLVVFSLLAVATVQAHSRLAAPMEAAVVQYYAADSAAEEILAQLRAGQMPEGVRREGDRFYYLCPISETQALAVTVAVAGRTYEILQWQAVPVTQWEGESGLPVWPGKE